MSLWIKSLSALTSFSIAFLAILCQDDDPLPCPMAKHARSQTIDTLENRLTQLKSELDLTEKQMLKLRVAVKRLVNQQPSLEFDFENLTDQEFYRGNPTFSEFWRSIEGKILTEEQKNRILEIEKALAQQVEATEINELAALGSAETMTQFHLARWKKSFQLSEEQAKQIEPLLKAQLEQGVEDARYPTEIIPQLQTNDILTESQLRLLDQLLRFKTVEFLEMGWTKFSCAECHSN